VAAKKRLSKSQIRDDKFIDTVAHYAGMMREHQRSIIGGLLVAVILIVAVSWGVRYVRESDGESRIAFSSALGELETAMQQNMPDGYQAALQSFESVRKEFGSRNTGTWAIYYTGFCKEQLKNFESALADYEAYLDKDSDGDFALAAEEGRASCLNSLGKSRQAAEVFEQLASRKDVSENRARQWLYRASQIYTTAQYYDNARSALKMLDAMGADSYQKRVDRDLAALDAMQG